VKTKSKAPQKKQRIFVVDDHPMMRDGLRMLIGAESDLAICGEADDGLAALDAILREKPDLVLADLTMPGKGGLELIKDLQAALPGLTVLVISMHDESLYAERVLRAGGRGYVMKQEGGKVLMQAIRQVLGGQIYVSKAMSARILESFSTGQATAGRSRVSQLTDREFEVFQLIGEGLATRAIAARLHLSVKTVEAHRANLKQKLVLQNANQLVHEAVRWVEAERGKAG
jgi:DNA-binding NarL/FixJ family response regulator